MVQSLYWLSSDIMYCMAGRKIAEKGLAVIDQIPGSASHVGNKAAKDSQLHDFFTKR